MTRDALKAFACRARAAYRRAHPRRATGILARAYVGSVVRHGLCVFDPPCRTPMGRGRLGIPRIWSNGKGQNTNIYCLDCNACGVRSEDVKETT